MDGNSGYAGARVQIIGGQSSGERHRGVRMSMAELVDRSSGSPLLDDMGGAVYVQTRDSEGKLHQYYFDGQSVVKRGPNHPDYPDLTIYEWGKDLTEQDLADQANDVVIGSPWSFAPSEIVDAVVIPYEHGVYEAAEAQPGAVAPTVRGHELLAAYRRQMSAGGYGPQAEVPHRDLVCSFSH
jgi:hypothetical protein